MLLSEAIAKLQVAGMVVKPYRKDGIVAGTFEKTAPNSIPVLEDVCFIYLDNDEWVFEKKDYIPGPGPHDIVYPVATLDESVSVALNYYFGKPLALEQWVFPVYKHPEWTLPALHSMIDNAQQITQIEWLTLREQYQEAHQQLIAMMHAELRTFTWTDLLTCVFTPVSHVSRSTRVLWLRRDLREAFIVDDEAG